jgi:hypothetical protein
MAETPRLTPARGAERAQRRERLARALRDNLRRRKEQARARDADAADLSGAELSRKDTERDPRSPRR